MSCASLISFVIVYCLLIVSGYLAIVLVAEYHVTTVTASDVFIEVWQQKNETLANLTQTIIVNDVYLYKTVPVVSWRVTENFEHGTNASNIIQKAFNALRESGGRIFLHPGSYNFSLEVSISHD